MLRIMIDQELVAEIERRKPARRTSLADLVVAMGNSHYFALAEPSSFLFAPAAPRKEVMVFCCQRHEYLRYGCP
jgi:hypothetical protein